MKSILIAAVVGLVVSILLTPYLIKVFSRQGFGQEIRDDGPQTHLTKRGTPTMGGTAIIIAMWAGYIVSTCVQMAGGGDGPTASGWLLLYLTTGLGVVGMLDDYIKIRQQRSLGLNKRAKLAGQLLVALGFALACVVWLGVDTHLSFTRFNSIGIQLGRAGWVILAVLVILGTTNAVNLTDGLDGLAAGSSAFTFAAFTIIGFYQLRHFNIYRNPAALDEAVLAAAMVGACAGFLWWNAAPARIFMGDTGSLGIGAAMASLALLLNVDLLLPVVGGLFVLETVSVIVQVASFRLARRRVLRMAPIHHHFELLAWSETTIILRFWIVAAICAAIGFTVYQQSLA